MVGLQVTEVQKHEYGRFSMVGTGWGVGAPVGQFGQTFQGTPYGVSPFAAPFTLQTPYLQSLQQQPSNFGIGGQPYGSQAQPYGPQAQAYSQPFQQLLQ